MRIFIYRDAAQRLCSVCSRPFYAVGLFLEQGIGNSAHRSRKLLALCQAVATQHISSWEGANRHFQIFIGPKQVLITYFDPHKNQHARLPLSRFIHTVQLWERAIAQHLNLPYQVNKGISLDANQLESIPAEPNEELKELPYLAPNKKPSHTSHTVLLQKNYLALHEGLRRA